MHSLKSGGVSGSKGQSSSPQGNRGHSCAIQASRRDKLSLSSTETEGQTWRTGTRTVRVYFSFKVLEKFAAAQSWRNDRAEWLPTEQSQRANEEEEKNKYYLFTLFIYLPWGKKGENWMIWFYQDDDEKTDGLCRYFRWQTDEEVKFCRLLCFWLG